VCDLETTTMGLLRWKQGSAPEKSIISGTVIHLQYITFAL